MKRLFTFILVLGIPIFLLNGQTVSELFVTMPMEKTPLLTLNDKKEMVECWNQHLDTAVRNKLGGSSRIDTLSTDYMKIHLSDAKTMTLFLTKEGKIGLVTTLYSPQGESTLEYYDTEWSRVEGKTQELRNTGTQEPSNEFTLVEYLVDPKTKEITVKYNYPLKGEQIDK